MNWTPLSLPLLGVALVANLLLGAIAWRRGSVSASGFGVGVGVGTVLFWFGGFGAFLTLVGFFVIGSAATKMGWSRKTSEGLAQEEEGRRGARHALANCGTGLGLALAMPFVGLPVVGVALGAAFATALSDTLGSEIGQLYGRRTILPTTLRPVPRGTEGAVSLEGTLAGIAGSALMGVLGAAGGLFAWPGVAIVVIAAFAGTSVESYVGAIWGRNNRIGNEAMNFLNTLVGAGVAGILAWGVL